MRPTDTIASCRVGLGFLLEDDVPKILFIVDRKVNGGSAAERLTTVTVTDMEAFARYTTYMTRDVCHHEFEDVLTKQNIHNLV